MATQQQCGTAVGTHRTMSIMATDNRSGPICFRCGERGHLRFNCTERVFCDYWQNIQSQLTSLQKATRQHTQPNRQSDRNGIPPHSNTTTFEKQFNCQTISFSTTYSRTTNPELAHDPDTLRRCLTHNTRRPNGRTYTNHEPGTKSNKWDDTAKQMMKNIKIFDGSNKAECINWISQVEAAAKFTNTPFRELICQSMAPAMLHIFSELSAMATDEVIKEAILTNYSDIPSTTEAASRLQNIQISAHEPLVTFNHRYEAIHKVAFGISTRQQENKTVLIEYTKKLPVNTRDSY